MSQFEVRWIDRGREPQCDPNPAYPQGIDLDVSEGAMFACTATLPYPARRCGIWSVHCKTCNQTIGCTTAGRPDDPRSLTMACKSMAAKEASLRIQEKEQQ